MLDFGYLTVLDLSMAHFKLIYFVHSERAEVFSHIDVNYFSVFQSLLKHPGFFLFESVGHTCMSVSD